MDWDMGGVAVSRLVSGGAELKKDPWIGLNLTYSIITIDGLNPELYCTFIQNLSNIIQNDLFPCLGEQSTYCGITDDGGQEGGSY